MANLSTINKLPIPTVPGNAATSNGGADIQAGNKFGEVLARQVRENTPHPANTAKPTSSTDKAPPSADAAKSVPSGNKKVQADDSASGNIQDVQAVPVEAINQPLVAIDSKILTGKEVALKNVKDDQNAPNPNSATDTPGALIAMLQPLQEIRNVGTADISGETLSTKGNAAKTISSDLLDAKIASHAAKDAPDLGLAQTDAAKLGDKLDLKQLPANNMKFAEQLNNLILDHQSSAPLAQNVAAVNAPNLLTTTPPALPGAPNVSRQTVSTPLGSSGWANDFSQKISWMSTSRTDQVAELHLNPPNLGPLDVVLKISDNQATAFFTSPHSAVREAVENAMPRLREILADSGVTLGNTTVSDQSPRDDNASAFSGQQSNSQAGRWTSDAIQENIAAQPAASQRTLQRHNGMVDTFA